MIDNNPEQFFQLLEQADASGGGGFGGSGQVEVTLSPRDQESIARVCLHFN